MLTMNKILASVGKLPKEKVVYNTPQAAANYFYLLADKDGVKLSNLTIQFLVYILHGYCLSVYEDPLFLDEVYAWHWGPVIHSLYDDLRCYKNGLVLDTIPCHNNYLYPDEFEKAGLDILKYYGSNPKILHEIVTKIGSPWHETFTKDPFQIIPNRRISDHYRRIISKLK